MSMADRDGWIWYDGKMVPWRDATTHVLTHTLHYGMGVFEGVRCYKTVDGPAIFRLRDHTNRLFRSAHIYGMKIPFTKDEIDARTDGVRAREQARVVLHPADRVLRLDSDGRRRQVQSGAASRSARGRGARTSAPMAIEKGIRVKTSSFTHHHPNITMCNAKAVGNYTVSILANQEALARRLRGGDAARPARLRVPGLGRERVHRARRRAAHARPVRRRAQRHHARHDHHVRARARHPGRSSGASRATRSTSPTRRSSPAPRPKSRRSASTTTARSAAARADR